MIEPRLGYNYAIIDENNRCYACRTYNVEIPLSNYIPVPHISDDYLNKYYNRADGKWYYEPEFVTEFIPV